MIDKINTTVTKMGSIAPTLPTLHEHPIQDAKGETISNFKGVTTEFVQRQNKANDTNNYLRMFTNGYNVAQHSMVVKEISTTLNAMGLKGSVQIDLKKDGSVMNGYVIFPDKVIKDGGERNTCGIQV